MAITEIGINKDTSFAEFVCDYISDLNKFHYKENLFGSIVYVLENEGFYIMNSEGEWIQQTSGGGGGGGSLPEVTPADNGKILGVINGGWAKANPETIIPTPIIQEVGTASDEIILSELKDGLYAVQGQHRVAPGSTPVFLSASNVIVLIQTINGVQKIRRITADDLTSYRFDGQTITEDKVATESFLQENGYVTDAEVDSKIAVAAQLLEENLKDYIDEQFTDIPNQDIRDLFS